MRYPDDGSGKTSRIPALDGLRGIAILLVLMLHCALFGSLKPAGLVNQISYTAILAGWTGVDLFFVLSGFLITGILYDARGQRHYFRNFFMRRVLRIFPLYYASLLVFLVILPVLLVGNEVLAVPRTEAPWFLLYLTNVRIAAVGWAPFGLLAHLWSLSVEEQFYLFWPLVVLVCSRRILVYSCVGIIIGSLLLRFALHEMGNAPAAYVLTPARFDSLAVGALLAIAARSPAGLSRLVRPARVLVPLCAAILLGLAIRQRGFPAEAYWIGTVGYSLLAIFFGSLLVLGVEAGQATLLARTLASRPLTYLGRYSYGLYVIHQPVLFLLPAWWSVNAWQPYLGSWLTAYIAFTISAVTLCIGLAVASWHIIEVRFLRLKSRYALPAVEAARPATVPHFTVVPR